MKNNKQTNDNQNKNEYVEIREIDFYPSKDNRIYPCSFRNKCDYYSYLKEYEKYVSDRVSF